MRAAAWAPLLASQVALLFTLSLVARWWRSRRPGPGPGHRKAHLLYWALSLTFFTAGAVALWYGTAFGWSAPTFRCYYLFGAFLSVPWLALGQVALLASRRTAYPAALFVVAFTVVGGFIVAFAPLSAPVAGRDLPDGHLLYGALPRLLVGLSNGLGALVILTGVAISAWRARSGGPAARSRTVGVLLIAAGVLAAGAGGALTFLGKTSANAVGVLIGVCMLYLGFLQAGRRVGRHRRT